MSKIIPWVVEENIRWLIKELRLVVVPYWKEPELRQRAASVLERLISELENEQTIMSQLDIDYMTLRHISEEDLKKIIREKLVANVTDFLVEHPELYSISKKNTKYGAVRYEINLSIMPPTEPKGVE